MRNRAAGWVAGVGLALAAAVPAGAEGAAGALKIAVVNINQTVDKYEKKKALEVELQAKIDAIKKRIDVLEDNIKNEEVKLKGMKGVDNQSIRDDLVLNLALMRQEREVRIQWHKELSNRENNEGMKELFKDVEAAIRKVGEKGSYDVILQSNPGSVLYLREGAAFDVTPQVVELLNKEYAESQGKPPDQQAPPEKK